MSADQIKRVKQAMSETVVMIARELTHSSDLRDYGKIESWKNHYKKLEAMLK